MTPSYDLASATAVILAGGLGTRLRSVVADRPKVLAPVGGRPFLSYLLDQIGAAGIRRVVLCTGYLGAQLRAAFGSSYGGLALVYSHEAEPAGTGGALRIAREHILSSSILVMNGDSYCDADLFDLWEWHHVHPAHITVVTTTVDTVVTTTVDHASSFGRVEVDSADRIRRFAEKCADQRPGRINAGLYLMHTALLERIPDGRPVSVENELFPLWVDAGGVFAYPTPGRFIDIGTPERLAGAEAFLRGLRSGRTPPGAVEEIASAFGALQESDPA